MNKWNKPKCIKRNQQSKRKSIAKAKAKDIHHGKENIRNWKRVSVKRQYVVRKVNVKLNRSAKSVVQFAMDFETKQRRPPRLWLIRNAIKKESNTRSPVLLCYFTRKATTAWFTEEIAILRYDSATCFCFSVLFFGRERSSVIIIIWFCFKLQRTTEVIVVVVVGSRLRDPKHTVYKHRECCSSCTMQLCISLLQSVWIQTSKLKGGLWLVRFFCAVFHTKYYAKIDRN